MVIAWLRRETTARIGSPGLRVSLDSTERSFRSFLAAAGPPIANKIANPATARHAASRVGCLDMAFAKRVVMRVPAVGATLDNSPFIPLFGRTCQAGGVPVRPTEQRFFRCSPPTGSGSNRGEQRSPMKCRNSMRSIYQYVHLPSSSAVGSRFAIGGAQLQ